jgi:hypothetical protein
MNWMESLRLQLIEWDEELNENYADSISIENWTEARDWMNDNPNVLSWGILPYSNTDMRFNEEDSEGHETQKDRLEELTNGLEFIKEPDTLLWTFSGKTYTGLTVAWKDPENLQNIFQIKVDDLQRILTGEMKPDFSNIYTLFLNMKGQNLESKSISDWEDWLDGVGDFWGGFSDLFKDAIGNRYDGTLSEAENREKTRDAIWIVTPMLGMPIPELLNWSSSQFRQLWELLSR